MKKKDQGLSVKGAFNLITLERQIKEENQKTVTEKGIQKIWP